MKLFNYTTATILSIFVANVFANQCSDFDSYMKQRKFKINRNCNNEGNVTELDCYFEEVDFNQEDINMISELGSLESLRLDKFNYTDKIDYSPLKKLLNLTLVDLEYSNNALKAFKDLKSIENLYLFRSDISSQEEINNLATLTNLETISITDCSLTEDNLDYTPLKSLQKLTKITSTHRESVDNALIFRNSKSLKELTITGNSSLNDEDMKIIQNFTELQSLSIAVRDLSVKDYFGLTKFKKLTKLSLDHAKVVPTTEIYSLTNLKELGLTNMGLDTIPNDLFKLINLESLDLSNNRLKEIPEYFYTLKNITTLNFSGNDIRKIPNYLNNVPSIKSIDLTYNENLSGQALTKELEHCYYYNNGGYKENVCKAKEMKCLNESRNESEPKPTYKPCASTTTVSTVSVKKTTTTTKSPLPTPVSEEGRCGSIYGKCPTGECCSKYGYCGTGEKYCGTGCQSEFGKCNKETTTNNSGKCGKDYGKCPSGECCSKYGYCGTSEKYCGTGCQSEFGKCNKKTTPNDSGKCGKDYGKCPTGECCSKYGYCGTSEKYCGTGCQSEFGKCNKVNTSNNSGKCGKDYGKCPTGECCSKYGYCGTGEKYCGTGCQSEFGKCNKKTTPNDNGKCGKDYGKCPTGECCSKYGYCGTSEKYCGTGCQSEFGKCK